MCKVKGWVGRSWMHERRSASSVLDVHAGRDINKLLWCSHITQTLHVIWLLGAALTQCCQGNLPSAIRKCVPPQTTGYWLYSEHVRMMCFSMSAVDSVQATWQTPERRASKFKVFPFKTSWVFLFRAQPKMFHFYSKAVLFHRHKPSPDAHFHIFGVEVLLEMFGFAFHASELIHIDELLFILIFMLCISFICITSSPSIFMLLCFFFFSSPPLIFLSPV